MPTPREVIDAYRRLGPAGFARAGGRFAAERSLVPLRRARLRVAPVRVSRAAVTQALDSRWREQALEALPVVAAWEPGESLLERVGPLMEHEFDLLGSGPTRLGDRIDWRTDFKSGRTWPLDHISRVQITYPDDSDIKVPWELSRCQHLPLLAAAHRLTGEQRYLDEIGAQITSFIADNPVEFGPCWACTMDVAIRATNWVATLALCPEQPWTGDALASLLLHGRFIRTHLEWGEVRGNHYLSDVAGLLPVAALFPREGWQGWAAAELAAEMQHQVRGDGCDHEASIPYHRLVTELFVHGTEAARALGAQFPDSYDGRLELMRRFARDYTRPDGLAPLVGDEDSGRFLPLGDYGGDPRDHRHLFEGVSLTSAAYPDGGYYVMRDHDLYVIVRCGDTGMAGLGGHSHNDQLAFELCANGRPVIIDPGSYLYTADPDARNMFRSTSFHATLKIDGREQNELARDRLFSLPDRTHAECLAFDGTRFEGRHHGFAPAIHRRALELADRGVVITDTIESSAEHDLEWTFPLAPGAHARVSADGLDFAKEDGWYSPRYGVRVPTVFLRARRRSRAGTDTTVLRVDAGESR